MRFTLLTTIVAVGALACGGEKKADETPAAGQPGAAPAAPQGRCGGAESCCAQ